MLTIAFSVWFVVWFSLTLIAVARFVFETDVYHASGYVINDRGDEVRAVESPDVVTRRIRRRAIRTLALIAPLWPVFLTRRLVGRREK